MNKIRSTLILVLVAIMASTAGFYLQQSMQDKPQPPLRPDFSLMDTEGNQRSIGEFDGQVILLNFWAAWCPPCKEEMPDFVRLQDDFGPQGFVVVGVAIDTLDNAQTFMDTVGVNYPVMLGMDEGIQLAQAYGNRLGALPFTVIIDRNGHIVSTHIAKLNYQQIADMIGPLL